MFLGSSLISWKSKKQHTFSRSKYEVEYSVLVSLACEIEWLNNLFKDLNHSFNQPTSVYCDNNSEIYLAHNPSFLECSKYIEIDYHVTREKIEAYILKLISIHTRVQIDDFLTKLLYKSTFETHISELGLLNLHSSAYGGCLTYG